MKKQIVGAMTALGVLASALAAVPAAAQDRRDRDHQGSYRDRDRHDDRRDNRAQQKRYKYYGGNYGYTGYKGRWRTGQRYPNYNQSRYVVSDYRAYGLPAPRQGYRYYRDSNSGDVVMAAIATGVIGLIVGGALSR